MKRGKRQRLPFQVTTLIAGALLLLILFVSAGYFFWLLPGDDAEPPSAMARHYARWQELSRRLSLYEERILVQANDHAQASLLAYQNDRGDFADVMRGYIDELNVRLEHLRLQIERAQTYAVLANLGGLSR